jgi:hypothetical protein
MKKVFVKWDYNDDYGYAKEANASFAWFDTMEEANAFVANGKERNGGYFRLWKIAESDFEEYEKMVALRKALKELEKKF